MSIKFLKRVIYQLKLQRNKEGDSIGCGRCWSVTDKFHGHFLFNIWEDELIRETK